MIVKREKEGAWDKVRDPLYAKPCCMPFAFDNIFNYILTILLRYCKCKIELNERA